GRSPRGGGSARARRALAARRETRPAALVGVAGLDDHRGRRRPRRRVRGQLAQPGHLGGVVVRRGPRLDDDHLALHRVARALRDERAHRAEVGRRLVPSAGPVLPLRVVRPPAERLGHRVQRPRRRGDDLGDRAHAAARLGEAAPLAAARLGRHRRRGRAEHPLRRAGGRGARRLDRRRRGSGHPRPDRGVRDLRHRHPGVRGALARRERRLLRARRVRRPGRAGGRLLRDLHGVRRRLLRRTL
ncbi:MAG: hypothetical protein AVDCRST_MAG85-2925, partial [uncultured Solirubrobacteraceae bacterium]